MYLFIHACISENGGVSVSIVVLVAFLNLQSDIVALGKRPSWDSMGIQLVLNHPHETL